MWTLLALCSVITSFGVQGQTSTQTTTQTTVEPFLTTNSSGCGGTLYNNYGYLQSPNYPYNYPNYADCTWYIRPGHYTIRLDFPSINLEYHSSCGYDAIYIYDGSNINSRLLGKVCRNSHTFHSTSGFMTVRFTSDNTGTSSGFRARYEVTSAGSCIHNCGYWVGTCSCASSCEYNGNCCSDYRRYCAATSVAPHVTTDQPSCRYNCGSYMGSCSCSSSCRYNGNCCYDYNSYCTSTTMLERPSCRYNCGSHLGSCSCSSSCRYNGNCCHDYSSYCQYSTYPTTAQPSCRYNCGRYLGSCSCSSSCRYNGNCCHDYYSYCQYSTYPTTTRPSTAQPSCRYNCGWHLGSCSCSSSCRYNGNCCHDYSSYCQYSTYPTTTRRSTAQPSCRYNCGRHLGSCSCSSSCRYNGNCCYDYYSYCQYVTSSPARTTPVHHSCRNNCGSHLGSCSCTSSCTYNGNCCYDFSYYCPTATPSPPSGTGAPCGGSLFGSGTLYSPNYPYYYHDNAHCVWQLRSAYDQRVFLEFTYLQLENCCGCDYIEVYDGPSVGYGYLGKVCSGGNSSSFYSTSNYLTVRFRTDGSVVGRGFTAEFKSTLPPSSGRVDCASDNMNIVLQRSYLNSIGYDGYSLYLNDPNCRPTVSSYQVVFSFPVNSCGNVRKFVNGRVVYTNAVRAFGSSSGEITRYSHFKLNVGCQMDQESVAQIMYVVRHHDNSSITGTGRFNTSMDFYTSSSYYYKVTEVPYNVVLNQNLYVQVDLRRGDSTLVLFLDTCMASPSPHDFHSRSYFLVRNGCAADSTYYAYVSGSRAYARFTFRAFQFLRATESVYIQCKVLICPASDTNSRCRRGCSRRVARNLESEHDSQTLVLGPIKLKEPEKKEEETQDKA